MNIKSTISNITIINPPRDESHRGQQWYRQQYQNTEGTWLLTDDTYTTLEEGYTLTINLDMAVGNVNLNYKEGKS